MAPATSNEAPKPACLPESGKLPPALLNPNSIVILRAFSAIDQIESGIRLDDAAVVQHGQREVAKVVSHVRQKLCRAYRYPDPEPDNPQVWQVLCTSGKDGKCGDQFQILVEVVSQNGTDAQRLARFRLGGIFGPQPFDG